MRQDVKETYIENGAFYVTTKKQLLNSQLRYGGNIGMIEIPLHRSFQIDTIDDLKLIGKLLK
jgi:N-acylneuraminate cytidylyltransferase